MTHLKNLMESVDYQCGHPAQELVTEGQGEKYDRIAVFAGADFVFCYDYNHHPFSLDLSGYQGCFDAYWMDPVTGGRSYFGTVSADKNVHFAPMERKEGYSDWVLVLLKRK